MTKRHFKTIFAAVAATLMLCLSGAAPVFAEEYPIHLMVSPASQTLGKLEPGKSYEGKFSVRNVGTEEFDYKVYATPYTVQDEEYNPEYTTTNNYTYIAEWFTFSKTTGHLDPRGEEEISYTVKVPANAAGGAQNAAIMVETEDSVDPSKTVSATSRVGIITYSQIDGVTNPCGKIIEKKVPSLLLNPPISASALVENCGNIDLNVKYVFTVTPLFSSEPVYTNEDSPKVLATLPETRRYTNLEWENSPSIGIYKTKLSVTYNGKTEDIEKIVLICPLWVIILVIVFIGAVVFWLVSRNKERKAKRA